MAAEPEPEPEPGSGLLALARCIPLHRPGTLRGVRGSRWEREWWPRSRGKLCRKAQSASIVGLAKRWRWTLPFSGSDMQGNPRGRSMPAWFASSSLSPAGGSLVLSQAERSRRAAAKESHASKVGVGREMSRNQG